MMQDSHWQGYFVYADRIYPMKLQQTLICMDPPGTIQCSGSDDFGTFTMKGSFYMNYCIFTKKYQEDHQFRYIGEIFYPPEMEAPLHQDLNKIIEFNKKIEEIHKARLILFKAYTLKTPPIKRIMIRGFYQYPEKKYGNIFCLTFVPKSQTKEQSTQFVEGQGVRQVDKDLIALAHQIVNRMQQGKFRLSLTFK